AYVGVLQNIDSFRVSRHKAVLDAVVHHLHEMTGARRTAMQVAVFGRGWPCAAGFFASGGPRRIAPARGECFEDWIEMLDHLPRASDHLAITPFQAPDAAACAHIDIVDSALPELFGTPDIVNVVGISAIDQNVASLQFGNELFDRGIHARRRYHHPDRPRRRHFLDKLFERGCSFSSLIGHLLNVLGMSVEDDALMLGPQQAQAHIAPHAPEADHSDLHVICSCYAITLSW